MIRNLVYAPEARKRGSEKWTKKWTLKKTKKWIPKAPTGQIAGGGWRSVRMASGLEIDEFEFLSGTPRTPEGAADSIAPRTPPGQGRFRLDMLGGSDSSCFSRRAEPARI